jgi:hypothetical protein
MRKNWTKEFEEWWSRADVVIPGLEPWQHERVKRIAFSAWRRSRALRGLPCKP